MPCLRKPNRDSCREKAYCCAGLRILPPLPLAHEDVNHQACADGQEENGLDKAVFHEGCDDKNGQGGKQKIGAAVFHIMLLKRRGIQKSYAVGPAPFSFFIAALMIAYVRLCVQRVYMNVQEKVQRND